jgi:hypothetical protein
MKTCISFGHKGQVAGQDQRGFVGIDLGGDCPLELGDVTESNIIRQRNRGERYTLVRKMRPALRIPKGVYQGGKRGSGNQGELGNALRYKAEGSDEGCLSNVTQTL